MDNLQKDVGRFANFKKKRKKNKKGSLFAHYFGVSVLIVLLGFVIIGFSMMFFTASQWWTDKVDAMTRNAQNIASSCEELYNADFGIESKESIVKNSLTFMHEATASEYFITDINGDVIFCCDTDIDTDVAVCQDHKIRKISDEHMTRAIHGGFSDYTTGEEFGMGKFVVAVPIKNNGETISVIFAVEDAITGFLPYVAGIVTSM